jgi:hypothetical protein
MLRYMPRYWLLWLAGTLYVVFACGTHAVMAAPLAPRYVTARAIVAHPSRGTARSPLGRSSSTRAGQRPLPPPRSPRASTPPLPD